MSTSHLPLHPHLQDKTIKILESGASNQRSKGIINICELVGLGLLRNLLEEKPIWRC